MGSPNNRRKRSFRLSESGTVHCSESGKSTFNSTTGRLPEASSNMGDGEQPEELTRKFWNFEHDTERMERILHAGMSVDPWEFDLQELMQARGQSEQLEMAMLRIRFEGVGEEIIIVSLYI